MKKFLIHYSAFLVMFMLVAGICWIAGTYRIRSKQAVTLFVTDGGCKAYIDRVAVISFRQGDTLAVGQTPYGDFAFAIDSVAVEPSSQVLFLVPLAPSDFAQGMRGNTYASGFLFSTYETIGKLILRKLDIH